MENKWTLHPNGLETVEKDQLYTALANAQAEFPHIETNRKAFKNKYSDMYALFHPVYPVLKKYGISIGPWGGKLDGEAWIGARLRHKSGQYETNVFKFEMDEPKITDQFTHKKQSAFTYFNRNHMKDMLGLLLTDDPQDDDGQGEYKAPHVEQQPNQYIRADQVKNIIRLIGGDDYTLENLRKTCELLPHEGLDRISADLYDKVIEDLERIRKTKLLNNK